MGELGTLTMPQVWRLLQVVEHELLLFAAFWFILGAIDELTIDVAWLWLRLTRRIVPIAGSCRTGQAMWICPVRWRCSCPPGTRRT